MSKAYVSLRNVSKMGIHHISDEASLSWLETVNIFFLDIHVHVNIGYVHSKAAVVKCK